MLPIKDDILGKIKKEAIKPRPKSVFVLKHVLLGALLVLGIMLGALAVNMTIFELSAPERAVVRMLENRPILFTILPYIWIAIVICSVFVSSLLFSKSKKGYRHNAGAIVAIIVGASIVLGVVFHVIRVGEFADSALRLHPGYERFHEEVRNGLSNPEEGRLMGKVIETSEDSFVLSDREENTWTISCSEDFVDCQEKITRLQVDRPALILGTKVEESTFEADDIRKPRRGGMRGEGKPQWRDGGPKIKPRFELRSE